MTPPPVVLPMLSAVPSQDADGGRARARIERQVVGAVLNEPEILGALDDLETDVFTDHRLKTIWDAIRNGATGIAGVEAEIERVDLRCETQRLEALGGVAFLGDLLFDLPHDAEGRCTLTRNEVAAMGSLLVAARRGTEAEIAQADARARAAAATARADALERVIASLRKDAIDLVAQAVAADPDVVAAASRDSGPEEDAAAAERIAAVATAQRVNEFWPPLDDFFGEDEPDDDDREDWIIRDLIPRAEPVLWAGPMKSGKTWAALDLCIAIALGQPWLACENTFGGPAKVAGLFLEDGKRRLRKRLWELCRARGVTPNDPRLRENLRISRKPLRLPTDHAAFVKRTKPWGPKVIVVDNLTRVMNGDPNSTKDASAFTASWLQLGDELDASIAFLHHMKKLGSGDDDKRGDPFEAMRGSSDFGAAARNLIASIPLRVEGEHISELRIRGNLDLRREGFVLGFERKEHLGRWHAKLVDRGEIAAIKTELFTKRREDATARKKAEMSAAVNYRRTKALELARVHGGVSGATLSLAVGVSANTALRVLKDLESSGVFRADKKRGFVFSDAGRASSVDAPPRTDQPSLGGLS